MYLHCNATRVLKVTASLRWNPWLLDQQLPCFQKFHISLKCYLRFGVFQIKLTFKKRRNIHFLLTFGNNIGFRQYYLPSCYLFLIIFYSAQAIIFFNLRYMLMSRSRCQIPEALWQKSSSDPQYIWSCFLAFLSSLFDSMKMKKKERKRKWTLSPCEHEAILTEIASIGLAESIHPRILHKCQPVNCMFPADFPAVLGFFSLK